uniref:Uncharacterized protein n=1 Tax=Trichogramma kaykai TaxID=54128 RepID=A0ABD2XM51_9HYME
MRLLVSPRDRPGGVLVVVLGLLISHLIVVECKGVGKFYSRPMRFRLQWEDQETSATNSEKEEKHPEEDYEQGDGHEHKEKHYHDDSEEDHESYDSHHSHSKGHKGHHDKSDHGHHYQKEDTDGKGEHEAHGYELKYHQGEKGAKSEHFEEEGHHQKGHNTKGEHNIHKKDEYDKKHDFYDEFFDDGDEEHHRSHHHDHKDHAGAHHENGHDKDAKSECVGKTSAAGSLEIVTSRPYDDSLQDYNSDQNFINMNNPLSMLVYESKKINPKSTWATNVPSNAQITDRIATISPVEVVTPFRSRRGKNFKESKNVQLIFPVTQKTTTATTTTTTTTQRYEKDQEVTLPSEPLLFGFKGDGSDGKNISEMIDSQTGAAKATSTKWSDEKLPSIVQKYDRVPRPFSLTANSLNDKKRVPKKDFDKQTTTTYSYSASAPLLVPLKSLNDLENDTGQFKKSQGRLMKQSSSLIAQAINNLDNSQGSYYPGSTREIPKTTTSLPTTTQSVKISSTTITSEKTDDDLVSTTEAISEFEEVTESNEEPYSKYDDDEDYNASNGSSSNESYNNEISNHKKSAEENEDPLDNESTEIVNVTFESIERPENETQKLKTENSTDTDYDQLLGQNIQVVEKVEQSVNGSVKSNDSIAQADHKLEVKDQKESHEAREGAFDEHHDENGVEEDEKSHKDYDEHERHRDTEKGHLDKASHDRETSSTKRRNSSRRRTTTARTTRRAPITPSIVAPKAAASTRVARAAASIARDTAKRRIGRRVIVASGQRATATTAPSRGIIASTRSTARRPERSRPRNGTLKKRNDLPWCSGNDRLQLR